VNRQFSVLIAWLPAAVLLAACATAVPHRAGPVPVLALDRVDLVAINLAEQRIRLQVRLLNPGDSVLTISGITGTLYVADQEFAQGGCNQSLAVPVRGVARFDLDLMSTIKRFRKHLRKWAQQDRLPYHLAGTLTLADYSTPVPFEYRGEIDLKRMLGEWLQRL
jgi:LEA14-like dessication related protein